MASTAFSTAAQLNVAVQARRVVDGAAAANISVFNTGIVTGSAAAGLVLHLAGFTGLNLLGAGLVIAGLTTAVLLLPSPQR